MLQPLRVAVCQPPLVSYDVEANALAHVEAIRAADARVVVFPELSLTGYELDAPSLAPFDARLAPIIEACRATASIALVGAPIVSGGGAAHIAMLAVQSSGVSVAYRKVWLGDDEARRFSPGTAPCVLEVDGWRLGLAICKDTGIPQHASDTAALGMDVYVAGMVEAAVEASVPAERARRIAAEHGVWVAFASFAGPTGGGFDQTAGRSGIWCPAGLALAEAGPDPGAIARASID
jgi:predicted amidohydrolase